VYAGTTNQVSSVVDSAGSAWTRIGAFAVAGHNSDGEMWYAVSAGAATSVTVFTTNPAVVSLEIQEFSGVATTSPLDVSTGTSNSGTLAGSGTVTPATVGDLAVGFVAGHSNSQAISVTAPGFTAQAQQNSIQAGGYIIASVVTGYKVLSSTNSQTFTGGFMSSMYWGAGIAAFKAGTTSTPPPPPDYSLAATPSSDTVVQGASTSYTVNIARTGGFTGLVTLSMTGLPSGASPTFNPNPTSGASSSLSVTTSSTTTPAGAYPLTITGVARSLTHTTSVTLVVHASPKPDYSLSATPSRQTVVQGAATSYTVNVARTGGFTGSVTLSVTGLPTGASSTFNPNPATANSSNLTVTTSTTTSASSYVLTITGTSGSLTRTITVTLVVTSANNCNNCD
jgi:hypothetical protein